MAHAIRRALLGPPLPTSAGSEERLTRPRAMGAFGLDALSSVAYGPDQILYVLILAGSAGVALDMPVAFAIAALLGIVAFSYRQTVYAYPHGGGSYTVAEAVAYARSISDDVRAVHIASEEDGGAEFERRWREWTHGEIPLELVESAYREVVSPLLDLITDLAADGTNPVTVVVPTVVPGHIWQQPLHNQLEYVLAFALHDKPGFEIKAGPVRVGS